MIARKRRMATSIVNIARMWNRFTLLLILVLTSGRIKPSYAFDEAKLNGLVNVALNKPCSLSSTVAGKEAHYANDGKKSNGDSCSKTDIPEQVWWVVDLMSVYDIQYVRVYNTYDSSLTYHLKEFFVLVERDHYNASQYPPTARLCAKQAEEVPIGGMSTITCPAPMQGRYVYIFKLSNELLVCEVEVFAKDITTSTSYQRFLTVRENTRFDAVPFESFAVSSDGNLGCIMKCFLSDAGMTTVVQYTRITNRCGCIQFSKINEIGFPEVNDANSIIYYIDGFH